MKPFLLSSLLLLLCAAACTPRRGAPAPALTPEQREFGNLDRYAGANAALAGRTVDVVFLGNSITDAWADRNPDFFADNNFVGRGISGQTSAQLPLRFQQDVIDLRPRAVVINIGTNDVAENTGPYDEDATVANITGMIDRAERAGIEVILASVLPATGFSWRPALGDRSAQIVALNARLRELARQRKLRYVDYHAVLKNGRNGMDPELAADGVHPTAEAYRLMEKTVLEALR